jgi:hypothetical protein
LLVNPVDASKVEPFDELTDINRNLINLYEQVLSGKVQNTYRGPKATHIDQQIAQSGPVNDFIAR